MATDHSPLFDVLLRPQATEACYSYIEQLVFGAIAKRPVRFDEGPDKLVDLVHLLDMTLQRAGVGWTSVVAKKLSKQVCVEILRNVRDSSDSAESMLEVLGRFMGSHPLLVRCEQEAIISELLRLLKLSSKHSPALLLCIHSVLGSCDPDEVSMYRFCSQALANMALADTSIDAILCMRILIQIGAEYISRDAQLTRTTMGLCITSRNRFHDNVDIRRLSDELFTALNRVSAPGMVVLAQPLSVSQSPGKTSVPESVEHSDAGEEMQDEGEEVEDEISAYDEMNSPRSSCPSL